MRRLLLHVQKTVCSRFNYLYTVYLYITQITLKRVSVNGIVTVAHFETKSRIGMVQLGTIISIAPHCRKQHAQSQMRLKWRLTYILQTTAQRIQCNGRFETGFHSGATKFYDGIDFLQWFDMWWKRSGSSNTVKTRLLSGASQKARISSRNNELRREKLVVKVEAVLVVRGLPVVVCVGTSGMFNFPQSYAEFSLQNTGG